MVIALNVSPNESRVILSLRRIRFSDADHQKRILRSYLLPTKVSAPRPVPGFSMAAGGSWDRWIPQDDTHPTTPGEHLDRRQGRTGGRRRWSWTLAGKDRRP